MTSLLIVLAAALSLAAALAAAFFRRRNAQIWIGAYFREGLRRGGGAAPRPVHVLFCVVDHYEPGWNGADLAMERARVATWLERYPEMAAGHRDADGRAPQHTFFFPMEVYREEHLDRLAGLCRAGYGDVEIHLHHHADTAAALREKLVRFKTVLHERHGLLRRNPATGQVEYGFVHGNWALDNAGPGGRNCGVDNELAVLRETGCYADFTLPAAPHPAQTRKINSIYYATGAPGRSKSHDTGVDARVGSPPGGDLLLIQGPLCLNWRSRKLFLFPRIENGDVSGDNPPTPERFDLWVRRGIHVQGRPEWVFVKVHTHGANEKNVEALLGEPMRRTLSYAERYNDGGAYRLHYVTAREMYDLVKAAEAGAGGDPGAVLKRLRESK